MFLENDMADGSAIEWTDATWNPVTGCTKITAGCDNCTPSVLPSGGAEFRDIPLKTGLISHFDPTGWISRFGGNEVA